MWKNETFSNSQIPTYTFWYFTTFQTCYMRNRIQRVPSHRAQKKHQKTRAEIPVQKAEQRRKYPDKNMAQVCQVWRVNLKWICVHWNGPGRHDSTFHSRLHFCLKEYVFCFQISRLQKKQGWVFKVWICLCSGFSFWWLNPLTNICYMIWSNNKRVESTTQIFHIENNVPVELSSLELSSPQLKFRVLARLAIWCMLVTSQFCWHLEGPGTCSKSPKNSNPQGRCSNPEGRWDANGNLLATRGGNKVQGLWGLDR